MNPYLSTGKTVPPGPLAEAMMVADGSFSDCVSHGLRRIIYFTTMYAACSTDLRSQAQRQPLNSATLPVWKARLAQVTYTSQPRFGALSLAQTSLVQMLRHLRRTLEPVTGEFEPPQDMSNYLTRSWFFRTLFLAMPWPKGKVKAPGWLTPEPEGDVEAERTRLFATLDRFVAMHEKDQTATTHNPLLGPVSLDYVSRLQGKHLEHHCDQFGV